MKILFATAGEKEGKAAIGMLERFNLGEGDEIRVISVIDMAIPMSVDIYGGYLPDTAELEQTAKENAAKLLEETAGNLREHFGETGVNISTDMLFGSPESRIVEAADEMKPNLVVVGSHGYKAWERFLLGSVSDSVLHHVPCSVLIVKCP